MAKRGQGEGNWTERDGGWQYRVTVKYADGTTARKAFRGRTKGEAKAKADEAQAQAAGGVIPEKGLSLREFLRRWLQTSLKRGRLRPNTVDDYERNFEKYVIPVLGALDVSDLTVAHVQGLVDIHLNDGVPAATVKAMHRVFRSALSTAVKQRLLPTNPASTDYIELPKHKPKPQKALEPDDIKRLMDKLEEQLVAKDLQHEGDAAVIFVALTTGMRNEEIIGLLWDDVDLKAGKVHIRRTVKRVRDRDAAARLHTNGKMIQPKRLHVDTTKSGRERWTGLWPEAVEILVKERDRQAFKNWGETEVGNLVFRNRYGKPLTNETLNSKFKRFQEMAKVSGRSFYALRHTFASMTIAAGEDPVAVADAMGHTDPGFTMRVYAQAFEQLRTRRMERTREQFRSTGTAD